MYYEEISTGKINYSKWEWLINYKKNQLDHEIVCR